MWEGDCFIMTSEFGSIQSFSLIHVPSSWHLSFKWVTGNLHRTQKCQAMSPCARDAQCIVRGAWCAMLLVCVVTVSMCAWCMREAVRKITRLSSRHTINRVCQSICSECNGYPYSGYLPVTEGLIVLLQLQSDAGPDILYENSILVGWTWRIVNAVIRSYQLKHLF